MLECVVNVSEGADLGVLETLVAGVADDLLDLHSDPHHNRSVFTLLGEDAPRRLATLAVDHIDLSQHHGVHPRLGAVDVVPFVPLGDSTFHDAIRARNRFAFWIAHTLGVPAFLYGDDRALPAVRKGAFHDFAPDHGPSTPHDTAGAVCVGARDVLIAYNIFVSGVTIDEARTTAKLLRSDSVRALALDLDGAIQVSMNLIAPTVSGPADVYDMVATHATIDRTELVGLLPADALARIPASRWDQLDVSIEKTIEFRIAEWAKRNN